jgi:hypothetical protein
VDPLVWGEGRVGVVVVEKEPKVRLGAPGTGDGLFRLAGEDMLVALRVRQLAFL